MQRYYLAHERAKKATRRKDIFHRSGNCDFVKMEHRAPKISITLEVIVGLVLQTAPKDLSIRIPCHGEKEAAPSPADNPMECLFHPGCYGSSTGARYAERCLCLHDASDHSDWVDTRSSILGWFRSILSHSARSMDEYRWSISSAHCSWHPIPTGVCWDAFNPLGSAMAWLTAVR